MALAPLLWPATAQAAPPDYRQLDASGLIGVLPAASEAPGWLGKPVEGDAAAAKPTQGAFICSVGVGALQKFDDQTDINGNQKADLSAYSFTNFGGFPSGGYSNMIARILQFPNAATAKAAWANLRVQSQKCAGAWSVPYPADNGTFNGRQAIRVTVSPGSSLYGSSSVVVNKLSRKTREGAASPDSTGQSVVVWRVLGNVIYQVEYTKVVSGNVPSAISVADRMTIDALSAVVGERYLSLAAG